MGKRTALKPATARLSAKRGSAGPARKSKASSATDELQYTAQGAKISAAIQVTPLTLSASGFTTFCHSLSPCSTFSFSHNQSVSLWFMPRRCAPPPCAFSADSPPRSMDTSLQSAGVQSQCIAVGSAIGRGVTSTRVFGCSHSSWGVQDELEQGTNDFVPYVTRLQRLIKGNETARGDMFVMPSPEDNGCVHPLFSLLSLRFLPLFSRPRPASFTLGLLRCVSTLGARVSVHLCFRSVVVGRMLSRARLRRSS